MGRPRYYGDFGGLSFPKKGSDIITKCEEMRTGLMAKIEERQKRIIEAANEAGMESAGDVLVNLQTIADGVSGAGGIDMTVGLAAKLKGELGEMNKEKAEVAKLDMIINNLPKAETFTLNFSELEYFGF